MLSIFEHVAVDPYIYHGFQLTMVGRQWVCAKNTRIVRIAGLEKVEISS